MRELRFRVWDKKKKCYLAVLGCSNLTIYQVARAIVERGEENIIIEQYTGLKDQDGREIYEGDIVRAWIGFAPGGRVGVIKYDDGMFFIESPDFITFTDAWICNYALTTIGNIHEKPDLLKEKE